MYMGTSVSGATDTSVVEATQETVITLKKLTVTIERNNEVTTEQNEKMVRYNKRLLGLTYVIGALAFIQLLVMIFQMVGTCRL
jgi:hypothetical protein